MDETYTVSRYLISRLQEAGIHHLFGVPGDYNLDFLDQVLESPIRWVGNCNELNAGYAADGYARLNGIGAAVVTYGVGGLSIINAVAGAYAEQVPLIIISGAPPVRHRESGALMHHLVSHYDLQLDIFRKLTADAAILMDPVTSPGEIDRVIRNVVARKLPGYLELPSDIALAPCRPPVPAFFGPLESDRDSLAESVSEAAEKLKNADHPVILAGVELLRYGLGKEVLRLVEVSEIPFATMLSSKTVLPELHPQFIGIYQGGWSKESVKQQVEDSDCLLSLGVWITDFDTGLFSIHLNNKRIIAAGGGQVRIGNHFYPNIQLGDLIGELIPLIQPRSYLVSHPAGPYSPRRPFIPEKSRKLSASRLYECINYFLDDRMILLAEPGDAICAATEFHIEEAENFIVQDYYCSIGYCTPAALGVALARPGKRPVVLSGDGAFQMTAQEVSTLIRLRCPAIIIIINNDGYQVERELHQDNIYNEIQMWRYAELPAVFGDSSFAEGFRVTTEEELVFAIKKAIEETNKLTLIEAWLPDRDCSAGLKRLGETIRKLQAKR